MASEGDLAMIEHVVHSAYQDYIPRIGRPPAPMTDDYRPHVAAGNVWVLVLDSKVVGLIVLLPKANYMLLDNVAVAPEKLGGVSGAVSCILPRLEPDTADLRRSSSTRTN